MSKQYSTPLTLLTCTATAATFTNANTNPTYPFRRFHLTTGVAGSSKKGSRKVESCNSREIDEPRCCGEDAFVNITSRFPACIGVLDGVGGWADYTPDAGVVSHLICDAIKKEFVAASHSEAASSSSTSLSGSSPFPLSAAELLKRSYTNAKKAAPKDTVGSTTACVAVIQPDLELDVVNLGDSGLFVVRDGKIVFHTRPTVEFPATSWSAAAPKQLAIVSDKIDPKEYISSPVKEGSTDTFKLQANDWVFAASDGVLDNLLLPGQRQSAGLYKFASIIQMLATNPEPSQVALQLVLGCKRGPKVDDITALVLRVDEDAKLRSAL